MLPKVTRFVSSMVTAALCASALFGGAVLAGCATPPERPAAPTPLPQPAEVPAPEQEPAPPLSPAPIPPGVGPNETRPDTPPAGPKTTP